MSDGTSFERRLDELLKQEGRTAAPEPVAVIAGARRRGARRRVGAGAAVLAVAVIAGGTALTLGDGRSGGVVTAAGAPTAVGLPGVSPLPDLGTPIPVDGPAPARVSPVAPEASGPGEQPGARPKQWPESPVKQVAPGERVAIVEDFRMSVTATESCVEQGESVVGEGGRPVGCRDATSDNLDHSRPNITAQSAGGTNRTVVTGMYLGPVAPARIVVELKGTQVTATLVTTPGMKSWTAYYAVVPGVVLSSSGPNGPRGSAAVAAWAADGTRLADLIDPRRPDPWATVGSGTGTPSAG
ncbi:hypothetical protein ABZW10_36125 [Kitasatospora sp. NPDC004723]|uniref:hypothetical protein n=1 Tax=Kitasatospora sp. NPDC004723 TaxID=3154288 RepID=UPI0033BF6A70